MKKKLLKNKIEKDNFLAYFQTYLDRLSGAKFSKSGEVDFDRKFFGWDLYFCLQGSELNMLLVEPRCKLQKPPENTICLSENQGLLTIKAYSESYDHTFEIECHPRLAESKMIRSYFRDLNNSLENITAFTSMKANGLVYLLSAIYTELIFDAPHLDQYLRDSKRQMMLKISSSIKGKIGTAFSAQDVVDELGYSIQYLNKVSQDFRSLSLNSYINFSKLESFRNKLVSSNEKISILAAKCGFPDVNYLIQLFKKTYSITPLQLRKKLKSSSPEQLIEMNSVSGFEVLNETGKPLEISSLSVKDKRCTLLIANSSAEPLEVYWLSPDFEEVPMTLLSGFERFHLGSAEGHCWLVRKGGSKAYYMVGKNNCLIVF